MAMSKSWGPFGAPRAYKESRQNAAALWQDPIAFYMRLSHAGEALAVRDIAPYACFERSPAYLVNDPEAVRQVLASQLDVFTKRGTRLFEVGQRIWGRGLFTIEGKMHQERRRSLQPLFHHTPEHVVEQAASRATQKMLSRWELVHDTIDVQQELLTVAIEILCDALIGDVSEGEPRQLAQLVEAVQYPLSQLLSAPVVLPGWVPLPAHRHLHRLVAELMAVIAGIVGRRQARREEGNGHVLDGLLSVSSDQQSLYDEIATLLFGGYRTTAAWIMWSLYLLSQHPHVGAQVREELVAVLGNRSPAIVDLAQLPYLDMVLKESLRLYPTTWMMDRRASVATALCEVPIARGSLVVICPYTLHRHATYWQRPNDFYPEHFQKEQVRARPKYAFCPFGAGRHVCIGSRFAEVVTKLVLIIVMQHYDLRLDPPDFLVDLAACDALLAHSGMPMCLVKREARTDAAETQAMP